MASTDDIAKALAAELRDARQRLGLSRTAAVPWIRERAGIELGARTITSYEDNSRPLSVVRFLQLSKAYEESPPGLLSEALRKAGEDPPACSTCGRE